MVGIVDGAIVGVIDTEGAAVEAVGNTDGTNVGLIVGPIDGVHVEGAIVGVVGCEDTVGEKDGVGLAMATKQPLFERVAPMLL